MHMVVMLVVAWGQGTASPCLTVIGSNAIVQFCMGEEEERLATELPLGRERTRHLEAAADRYRRAADLGASDVKRQALISAARVYDATHLNDSSERETILRELIVLTPNDPHFAFELAALLESRGFFDSAEDTLLSTRRQHPENIETYRRLAQLYARRVTGMSATANERTPSDPPTYGQPDSNGVYQVGGAFPPPRRLDRPVYPDDAKAAGITGAVQAEIVIDETGAVVNARVIKSVPLLDEAAIAAVKEWRFAPPVVNGHAVPVKMTVTVSFSQQ